MYVCVELVLDVTTRKSQEHRQQRIVRPAFNMTVIMYRYMCVSIHMEVIIVNLVIIVVIDCTQFIYIYIVHQNAKKKLHMLLDI